MYLYVHTCNIFLHSCFNILLNCFYTYYFQSHDKGPAGFSYLCLLNAYARITIHAKIFHVNPTIYTEYSYPHFDMETDEERVEKEYKEKRTKHLQKIAGQARVATPDTYEDLDLYVKMTQHYYVNYLIFTSY